MRSLPDRRAARTAGAASPDRHQRAHSRPRARCAERAGPGLRRCVRDETAQEGARWPSSRHGGCRAAGRQASAPATRPARDDRPAAMPAAVAEGAPGGPVPECERGRCRCRRCDHGYAILHDRKGGAHFLLISYAQPSRASRARRWQSRAPRTTSTPPGGARARSRLTSGTPYPEQRSAWRSTRSVPAARTSCTSTLNAWAAGSSRRWRRMRNASARRWTKWCWTAGRIRRCASPVRSSAHATRCSCSPRMRAWRAVPAGRAVHVLVAGMQYADGPGFAVLASDTAPGAELLLDAALPSRIAVPRARPAAEGRSP